MKFCNRGSASEFLAQLSLETEFEIKVTCFNIMIKYWKLYKLFKKSLLVEERYFLKQGMREFLLLFTNIFKILRARPCHYKTVRRDKTVKNQLLG